jgi:hypothetical protein
MIVNDILSDARIINMITDTSRSVNDASRSVIDLIINRIITHAD